MVWTIKNDYFELLGTILQKTNKQKKKKNTKNLKKKQQTNKHAKQNKTQKKWLRY